MSQGLNRNYLSGWATSVWTLVIFLWVGMTVCGQTGEDRVPPPPPPRITDRTNKNQQPPSLPSLIKSRNDGSMGYRRGVSSSPAAANVTLLGNGSNISAIALSVDRSLLAVATWKGVDIWDVKAKKARSFGTDSGPSLSFSRDGEEIAVALGHTVQLLNVQTGETRILDKSGKSTVTAVAFAPDGKTIAIGSDDETIRIWDRQSNEFALLGEGRGRTLGLAFSPDGKTLVSGTSESIKLWNIQTKRPTILTADTGASAVQFSSDGQNIVAASNTDWTIRVWDVDSLHMRILGKHDAWVHSVAFSPDKTKVASASGYYTDFSLRVWDTKTGDMLILEVNSNAFAGCAFISDAKLVSGNHTGSIRIWDVPSQLATKPRNTSTRRNNIGILIENGKKALKNGQRYVALNEFQQAVSLDPQNAEAHYGLARSLVIGIKADEEYKLALKLNPDNIEVYVSLVDVAASAGNFSAAEKLYEEAKRKDPHALELYKVLARAYANRGRWVDEIRILQEALRFNPEYKGGPSGLSASYMALGVQLEKQQQFTEAIDAYKKATDLLPNDSYKLLAFANAPEQIPLFLLGNLYIRLKRYDEAIEPFSRATRLLPPSPYHPDLTAYAHERLGDANSSLKKYDEAVSYYKTASISSTSASKKLGNIYFMQGQWLKAIGAYQRGLGLDYYRLMYGDEADYKLGQCYINLNDKNTAIRTYNLLKEAKSPYAESLLNDIKKKWKD